MIRIRVIVIVAVLLLAMAAPVQAASGDAGVHYTRMVVEPEGADMHVTLYYNTSFMTKVFSILFGTGMLEASIQDEVAGFDDITLDSLNTTSCVATFTATSQADYADGWYIYDNKAKLMVPVDELEIRGETIDRSIIVADATEVPDFFYQ